MRPIAAIAVLALVATGGCSSPEKERRDRQEELKEYSSKPEVRRKIAAALTKSQMAQRTPRLQALYDINGRWRSDAVESDRRLDLSFGMDGVVVVNITSPEGSLAYAQGKFTYDPAGALKVVLASPPVLLKPYASFVVRRMGDGYRLVIDDRKVRIFHV